MKIFILISLSYSSIAFGGDLPSWIVKGPMSDSSYHYVVCSHDGIDPEEARQIAESKCLASAAKLGGVNVRLTQKTIQSLTGSDSSEIAEIQPLTGTVRCEWIDRFLEQIKEGFRIWLRCRVHLETTGLKSEDFEPKGAVFTNRNSHFEATMILSMVPKADRIIVRGLSGERVIEPNSNLIVLVISNLDQELELKKSGYEDVKVKLPTLNMSGQKITKEILFVRK